VSLGVISCTRMMPPGRTRRGGRLWDSNPEPAPPLLSPPPAGTHTHSEGHPHHHTPPSPSSSSGWRLEAHGERPVQAVHAVMSCVSLSGCSRSSTTAFGSHTSTHNLSVPSPPPTPTPTPTATPALCLGLDGSAGGFTFTSSQRLTLSLQVLRRGGKPRAGSLQQLQSSRAPGPESVIRLTQNTSSLPPSRPPPPLAYVMRTGVRTSWNK